MGMKVIGKIFTKISTTFKLFGKVLKYKSSCSVRIHRPWSNPSSFAANEAVVSKFQSFV